jgi:hypothetical protein
VRRPTGHAIERKIRFVPVRPNDMDRRGRVIRVVYLGDDKMPLSGVALMVGQRLGGNDFVRCGLDHGVACGYGRRLHHNRRGIGADKGGSWSTNAAKERCEDDDHQSAYEPDRHDMTFHKAGARNWNPSPPNHHETPLVANRTQY